MNTETITEARRVGRTAAIDEDADGEPTNNINASGLSTGVAAGLHKDDEKDDDSADSSAVAMSGNQPLIGQSPADSMADPYSADGVTGMFPAPIQGKYRNLKLFDVMTNLSDLAGSFMTLYSEIDPDQLSSSDYRQLDDNRAQLKSLTADISFYLMNGFSMDDYQKNLFSYLLFQKLFVKIIKNFRRISHLDTEYSYPDVGSVTK